jgi:hypothetical protein
VVGEDQAFVREGIVRVLQDGGFDVVGTAADARDLIQIAGAHSPDVIVADIQMPPDHADDGLRAALAIRAAPARGRRARAVPVPRGRLRVRPGRRRRSGRRVPAEGEGRRPWNVHRRRAPRRQRRVGARSRRGRAAGRPQAAGEPARRPDAAGTPGTGPDRGGPLQRRHRERAHGHGGRRRKTRDQHLRQARAASVATGASPGTRRAHLPAGLASARSRSSAGGSARSGAGFRPRTAPAGP